MSSGDKGNKGKKRRGRPRIYASAAERQRAYRERLRERGLMETRRVVRRPPPDDEPVTSDVLVLDCDIRAALAARDRERKL